MKLALVGYGKMGHAVEELAASQGLAVVERFTSARPLAAAAGAADRPPALAERPVLVDFSVPAAVLGTARAAAAFGLPLVIGTTGWHDRLAEVREAAAGTGSGVVWAANFSLGVNVLYRLAEEAARLLAAVDGYDPFIHDWHHRFKLDRPSGTALELQRRMARHYGARQVPISCQRAGYIPSAHAVGFDSMADTIFLEHRARNRQGLAAGALLAAQWIAGRTGFYGFDEVLEDVLPAGAVTANAAAPAGGSAP
jgi:4-hydroxy-tetrahydrodipicolinate reductase